MKPSYESAGYERPPATRSAAGRTWSGLFCMASIRLVDEPRRDSRCAVASLRPDIECAGGLDLRFSALRPLLSMPIT